MVLRDLWKNKGLEKRTMGAQGKPTPTNELDKKHKQGTEMSAILFQRTPETLLFVKMTETTNWAIGQGNVLFYMQKIREDVEIKSLKQSQDIPGGRVVKNPRFHNKGCGFNPRSGKFRMTRGAAKKDFLVKESQILVIRDIYTH